MSGDLAKLDAELQGFRKRFEIAVERAVGRYANLGAGSRSRPLEGSELHPTGRMPDVHSCQNSSILA